MSASIPIEVEVVDDGMSHASAFHDGSVQHVITDTTRHDGLSTTAKEDATKVFFSHSSKDSAWVKETVERLEQNHSIECLFDERDFIAGRPIVDNIIRCIRNTDRTVLVLTPDFLDSPWCGYEAQMIFSEHLFREQKIMIPVLLSECIVPDFMKHLTYLDVRDPQFWDKFLEILLLDDTNVEIHDSMLEQFSSGSETVKFNGKSILPVNMNLTLDTTRIYESLASKGIRVPQDNIHAAVEILTRSSPVRFSCCYGCCKSHAMRIILWIFSLLSISVSLVYFLVFAILIQSFDGIPGTVFYCFAVALITSMTLLICMLKCGRIHKKPEREANLLLMDHGVILGIVPSTSRRCMYDIHFVHFRTAKCLRTLERYLKSKTKNKFQKKRSDNIITVEDTDDSSNLIDSSAIITKEEEHIKETARNYVANLCGRYVRRIHQDKLRNPTGGVRHCSKGVCLCQFVQIEYFKESV
uniref:Uncharacterized protein LOC100366292 n=1 Tax=Saccoglossus kowalevskii TaxID=10224 RepID=A0ABM0M1K7_SACKO|nr:PREDICTED: uncharacterized protein LOC100366292 [Saccoglossus kowalevskii]